MTAGDDRRPRPSQILTRDDRKPRVVVDLGPKPRFTTVRRTAKNRRGSRQSRIETPRADTTTLAIKMIPAVAMKPTTKPR